MTYCKRLKNSENKNNSKNNLLLFVHLKLISIFVQETNKQTHNTMKATTYNKSKIFRRAHYLVKTFGQSLSSALKQVWGEWRKMIAINRMFSQPSLPQLTAEMQYNSMQLITSNR